MSSTAAAADRKGREAETPGQIPAPGWKEIALRVLNQFSKDRVLLVAAGTTFYLLLAMVPALTAFVSLYGLFADPTTVQEHITFKDLGLVVIDEQHRFGVHQRLALQASLRNLVVRRLTIGPTGRFD